MKKAFIIGSVLLILAGVVVALGPRRMPHRCACSLSACIANLKQLDGAKATWAWENHKLGTDVPMDSDLFGSGTNLYIREKPVCPHGGHYALGSVGVKVKCSCGHTI